MANSILTPSCHPGPGACNDVSLPPSHLSAALPPGRHETSLSGLRVSKFPFLSLFSCPSYSCDSLTLILPAISPAVFQPALIWPLHHLKPISKFPPLTSPHHPGPWPPAASCHLRVLSTLHSRCPPICLSPLSSPCPGLSPRSASSGSLLFSCLPVATRGPSGPLLHSFRTYFSLSSSGLERASRQPGHPSGPFTHFQTSPVPFRHVLRWKPHHFPGQPGPQPDPQDCCPYSGFLPFITYTRRALATDYFLSFNTPGPSVLPVGILFPSSRTRSASSSSVPLHCSQSLGNVPLLRGRVLEASRSGLKSGSAAWFPCGLGSMTIPVSLTLFLYEAGTIAISQACCRQESFSPPRSFSFCITAPLISTPVLQ